MRPHKRLTTKTQLKNSLSPLRHFTEHLVCVFGKLPWENNLDHKPRDSRYGGSIAHPGFNLQQFNHSTSNIEDLNHSSTNVCAENGASHSRIPKGSSSTE
jgi:hypothetical protein